MSDLQELELLVTSRMPIIAVESREETRVVDLFHRIATRQGLPLYRWVASDGLSRIDGDAGISAGYLKPSDALARIHGLEGPGLFLLLDFHPYLKDPLNVRLLREIAQGAVRTSRTLVLVSPRLDLPGLRIETPVGPLRFDFGILLNPPPDADPWRFHLSVGQAF